MEIIHLILGKANPDRMNGVNKVVYQLATNQAKRNLKVEVWGITKDLTHNYEDRVFNTQLFKKQHNPFKLSELLKLALIKKSGKAVVHLHGGWIPVYATLAKFLSKHDIPFVITPHGAYNTVAMNKSKWIKKAYYQLFEKSVLKNAKAIHAIGKSEIDGLAGLGNYSNTFLSPYGFEIESIKPVMPNNEKFVIGFVGRITAYTKGLDIIIDSFKNVLQKNARAELWIVGEGDDLNSLKSKVQGEGISGVKFFGAKYGEEKNAIIRKMNVFVHASRNEGMPSAVIEAASFAVPVIVSPETNIAELVEKYKAGIALNENTVEELTSAFLEAISSSTEDLYLQGLCALKMIKEAFNWTQIVRSMNDLYAK
ncbi:Glycosyltransferase involved in cell wall bisynthesis [Marivirga sericea]|uniref:Glycosyltransferase involved in cell wall bisynthesis n=1 Tax=Marivirga sericea TaxID=1028 RepID=A0A1X7IAV3_9BACT|nr:glycosyltransferase family 4 protein [Marivirga sericea]SMG11289.1 Glycosyltransferase involved in cell wall bisynthesis [Marivirga sericea]